MTKPNFFIIGAPKCGTTALSVYLKEHPNVFFSDPKEPSYFAKDYGHRWVEDLDCYLALFKDADPARHIAIGEGSTFYLYSNVAVRNILEFQPGAKLIVMLRNPITLLQSFHSMMVCAGVENMFDLGAALRRDKARRTGINPPAIWEMYNCSYIQQGMLGAQMQKLYQNVSRDKVKVIIYDEFAENTLSIYKDVLEFLGLPYEGRTSFPLINESRIPKNRYLASVLSFMNRGTWPLRKMFGLYGTGIQSRVALWTSRPGKQNRLSADDRKELCESLKDDVRLLSEILNRDLSHWLEEAT